MRFSTLFLIAAVLLAPISCLAQSSFFAASQAASGDEFKKEPVYVEADSVTYDHDYGAITARGGVVIVQAGREVTADQINYNEKEDILTASGNIALRDRGGDTIYADFIELKDDMKKGVIQNLRLRLNDNSRLAARRAERSEGRYNKMDYAVFSPCLPCAKHPERAPTWQIKSKNVTHDQQAREIQYEDASLELWGVPVFYSPYLSHPDPNLKRRSGLLGPNFKNSDELGFVYRQAYYFDINPSTDLTVEPIIMTKDGFILSQEYRQRLQSGRIDFKGSVGEVDRRRADGQNDTTTRGHIDAVWTQDISDNWRSNLTIDRASDKTYLRRYRFSGDDVLISKAEAEGFFGQSYAQMRAMSFQGLRSFDKSRTTPIILPQMRYNYVSGYDGWGGLWQVNTDLLNLQRQDGTDSRRLSVDGAWRKPMRTDNGQLIDLTLRTQASGYAIDDYDDPTTSAVDPDNGWTGRAVPQAGLSWRYPLAGNFNLDNRRLTKYVEPIIFMVTSPNVGRNSKIPNEDSQAFEFDESNLFSFKRFPGYDRIAGGHRIDYGLNMGLFDDESRGGKIFIGQSWRAREDNTYESGSGLENHFSDAVGKIEVNPSQKLDLIYRFRIDTDKPAFRRSEFSAQTRTGALTLGLDYIFLDRLVGNNEFNDREQVGTRASWQMTENWNLSGRILSDINSSHSTREWGTGLTYHNECISVGLAVEREFITDSENKPGTSILLRVDLKHLGGEIQPDYFTQRRSSEYTGTLLPQQP
ncbi:MAG: LPS-assembly protein LptD [Alphaproteobacteria bacterium]|nr:MAG: LPS-assembly protein LptD [Alphaproteobacteria bacterium]